MNEILRLLSERATCRNYKTNPIEESIMQDILKAACQSPSGGGFQQYAIIRINETDKKEKLIKLCRGQTFIKTAPESLLFCIDYRRIKQVQKQEPFPYPAPESWQDFWMGIIDASIAAQNAVIAAESFGIKSVYIGNILHNLDETTELFELPEYVIPIILLTMGYPAGAPKVSQKFPIEVIVHDNIYQDPSAEKLQESYREKYNTWHMKAKDNFIQRLQNPENWGKTDPNPKKVKKWLENNQRISPYQYWFGIYYPEVKEMDIDQLKVYLQKQGIFTHL